MKFLSSAQIEARAVTLWRRFGLEPGFDIELLLDRLDLNLLWDSLEDEDDAKVFGALTPADALVTLNERHLDQLESNVGLRRFTLAHEIGHWILHAEAYRAGNLPLFTAGRTWCREKSRERAELQAEDFASFLLAPTELLRNSLPAEQWKGWPAVYRLAERFSMTPTAAIVRLEKMGLAHRGLAGIPVSGRPVDPNQTSLFT